MDLPLSLPRNTDNTNTQEDNKKDTIKLTFGSNIDLSLTLNNQGQSTESTTSVLTSTNNIYHHG